MFKKLFFCGLYILSGVGLFAQTGLDRVLTALEQDPDMTYASIGFCAIDVATNQVVAQRNPNQALIPASTLKVITTGTAMAILGGNYRFQTELQHDGTLQSGVLKGNLYIKGTGDPCLGSPMMPGVLPADSLLDQWVRVLQKAGIQQIEGAVVGDGTYFEDNTTPATWQWGDMGNYYGAGVGGLNLHDNMYVVVFQQSKSVGSATKIKQLTPELPFLKIQNEVTHGTSGSGDNASIYTMPYASDVVMRGTIPAGSGEFKIWGAIPDPALYAATALEKALRARGIRISKPATTQRKLESSAPRKLLHSHQSPTLTEIVKHTNEDSRNMYCEALVRAIGAKVKKSATSAAGILAIEEFWQARGVDMRGFFMLDGSGLSARNSMSSKTFAQIMRKMHLDSAAFGGFYELLAIAGSTGTLANIGRNSAAANNVRAKSGSINRVRAYTGYATTKSGKLVAFAMLVNNYSCTGAAARKKLEEVLIKLAELP